MKVETTTHAPSRQPAFHTEDVEHVDNYRTLSGLAIASLLFGLASPVCFAAPVFLAIPLFGTAISLVALRRIAGSDGALAGKWAAATGLALCIASAAATISYAQFTRFLHSSQAKRLGQKWVQLLVSGNTQEAFNLTVQSTRQDSPEPAGNFLATGPQEPPYEQFVKNPLVQALTSAGSGAEVRFAGTRAYDPQPNHQCIVQQQFNVTPSSSSTSGTDAPSTVTPLEAAVTLQLSRFPGESQLRWLVLGHSWQNEMPEGAPN
jgi:hypothetical protein